MMCRHEVPAARESKRNRGFTLPMTCVMSHDLTPRQQQILGRLVSGATAREIAEEFGISVETVRTHIKRIYEALEVRNRVELVRWVMRSWGIDRDGS